MKFLNIDNHNAEATQQLLQTVDIAANAAFILNKHHVDQPFSSLELAQTTNLDSRGNVRNIELYGVHFSQFDLTIIGMVLFVILMMVFVGVLCCCCITSQEQVEKEAYEEAKKKREEPEVRSAGVVKTLGDGEYVETVEKKREIDEEKQSLLLNMEEDKIEEVLELKQKTDGGDNAAANFDALAVENQSEQQPDDKKSEKQMEPEKQPD